MNHADRLARLDDAIARNAVAQYGWWDAEGGDQVLVAVVSPEAQEARTVRAVPEDVMPFWLAYALMFLCEELTIDYWPEFLRRFREAFVLFPKLTPEGWKRVEANVRKALRQRFKEDQAMLNTLADDRQLADTMYALPLHDGSDRFTAEAILTFIHEEAARA